MPLGRAKIGGAEMGTVAAAAGVLALAGAFKLLLVSAGAFPFDADEAVVGLMARHILQGNWPTFFYGQAYLGTLDAILVAGAFAVFGQSVAAIRLVQGVLYLGTVLTTMLIARRIGLRRRVAALSGLLLAVPTLVVTLYTTVSLGGYGEALLLGNLLILGALELRDSRRTGVAYLGWGALGGFALWTFALTLIYVLPCAALLAADLVRKFPGKEAVTRAGWAVLGGVLGGFPLVLWVIRNGPEAAVAEALGSAIAGASPEGLLPAAAAHLVNLLLFGPTVLLGLRAPWSADLLGVPVGLGIGALWVVAVGVGVRRSTWTQSGRGGRDLLLVVGGTLLAGFVLTPFGADPSGRYFLPLSIPLAILAAAGVFEIADRLGRQWAILIPGAILAFQAWSHAFVIRQEPWITTQFDASTVFDRRTDGELVAFLEAHGEFTGYSTYWVSYPLAFLSAERLTYVPHLPYHSDFRYTPRDDRYPPYGEIVAASERTAYITARQPWLDVHLRRELSRLEVGFRETSLGDYRIFHGLTRVVRPAEMGLGPEAQP